MYIYSIRFSSDNNQVVLVIGFSQDKSFSNLVSEQIIQENETNVTLDTTKNYIITDYENLDSNDSYQEVSQDDVIKYFQQLTYIIYSLLLDKTLDKYSFFTIFDLTNYILALTNIYSQNLKNNETILLPSDLYTNIQNKTNISDTENLFLKTYTIYKKLVDISSSFNDVKEDINLFDGSDVNSLTDVFKTFDNFLGKLRSFDYLQIHN